MSDNKSAVVWAEIPVTDLQKAKAFYASLFMADLRLEDMGPNPMVLFPDGPGLSSGHIYEGKPAGDGTGPTVHIAVPGRLEDAVERVRKAGGTIIAERMTVPAGSFAYCLDPDGNSIGVFAN